MRRLGRNVLRGGYGFAAVAVVALLIPLSLKPADTLPAQIPDAAFWRDDWQRFYANLATLPVDSSSTLIRSSHFAPGARLRRVPSNYVMLRCSIADLVKAFREGRIQNYYSAIQMSQQ